MKKVFAGFALALVLTGCSAEVPAAPAPSPTVSEEAPEASTEKDVTSKVQKIAGELGDVVTSAVEKEPGRIDVQTSIVDPRGPDGSRPALDAVRLCNKIVQGIDGLTHVKILEADRTTFAAYGIPIINDGKCGEY